MRYLVVHRDLRYRSESKDGEGGDEEEGRKDEELVGREQRRERLLVSVLLS